jgi:hypothetical protein
MIPNRISRPPPASSQSDDDGNRTKASMKRRTGVGPGDRIRRPLTSVRPRAEEQRGSGGSLASAVGAPQRRRMRRRMRRRGCGGRRRREPWPAAESRAPAGPLCASALSLTGSGELVVSSSRGPGRAGGSGEGKGRARWWWGRGGWAACPVSSPTCLEASEAAERDVRFFFFLFFYLRAT